MGYTDRVNNITRKIDRLLYDDEISKYGAKILKEDINKLLDEIKTIVNISHQFKDTKSEETDSD